MGELEQRVSDAEREQAVVWLRGHLVSGRLTLEEFSERIEQVYAAAIQADLESIRAGLPPEHEPVALPSRRRATRVTAALFARLESRGLGEFSDKILSAMRSEFGGHQEKKQ